MVCIHFHRPADAKPMWGVSTPWKGNQNICDLQDVLLELSATAIMQNSDPPSRYTARISWEIGGEMGPEYLGMLAGYDGHLSDGGRDILDSRRAAPILRARVIKSGHDGIGAVEAGGVGVLSRG